MVGAAVSTHDPVMVHFYERDAVSFPVVEGLERDSARGDYAGPMPGVVRPMLERTTEFAAGGAKAPAFLEEGQAS